MRMEALTWYQTVQGWLMSHQTLAVKYEDLLKDTKQQLLRILDFVGVPYSRQQLERVVRAGYEEYQRPPGAKFEHYTEEQKTYVRQLVQSIITALKTSDHLALKIEDYLSSEKPT